jgi:hypothetical protein
MRLLVLFPVVFAAACTPLATVQKSEPVIPGSLQISDLVGAWCAFSSDGKSCIAYREYFRDLTVRSCEIDQAVNKVVVSSAEVKLKGNEICLKVTSSNETSGTPVGYEFCSELVELTRSSIKYKSIPGGEIFSEKRVSPNSEKCSSLPN